MGNLINRIYASIRQKHRKCEIILQNRETISIELEITLRCNAACTQCSRHCNSFSYGESDMTITQIQKFIDQVISAPINLGHVTVMGGEPTVHPRFEEIVHLLYTSLVLDDKAVYLEIATNGIKSVPDSILSLPVIIRTNPVSGKDHRCQFIAPADTGQKTKPCDIPHTCGMALNCYGYFPCGAGGAIIRLFDIKELIRYDLPLNLSEFGSIERICSLCQASAIRPKMLRSDDPTPSTSFRDAIRKYHICRPQFELF